MFNLLNTNRFFISNVVLLRDFLKNKVLYENLFIICRQPCKDFSRCTTDRAS